MKQAYIAYKTSEVCAIYLIARSSAMDEWADKWGAKRIKNIFVQVLRVVELQGEAGASAKFSLNDQAIGKKDLALRTILDVDSYSAPSLVIAYYHWIAHFINLDKGADV